MHSVPCATPRQTRLPALPLTLVHLYRNPTIGRALHPSQVESCDPYLDISACVPAFVAAAASAAASTTGGVMGEEVETGALIGKGEGKELESTQRARWVVSSLLITLCRVWSLCAHEDCGRLRRRESCAGHAGCARRRTIVYRSATLTTCPSPFASCRVSCPDLVRCAAEERASTRRRGQGELTCTCMCASQPPRTRRGRPAAETRRGPPHTLTHTARRRHEVDQEEDEQQ